MDTNEIKNEKKEKDLMKIEVYGHEVIEKIPVKYGTSCSIYLPPTWEGKKVKVIRLE
jgi:hypothetical protein